MSNAYKEYYLFDAMRNLGEMTEYAHDACGVEPDRALAYFIISGFSERFENGDPRVVSGMSGTELYQASCIKCGMAKENWPKALVRYTTEAYYWIGYILAYYQWTVNLPFGKIISVVPASDLLRMYPALHTTSDDKAIETINELYLSRNQVLRLQAYRKRIGLSQSELARRSGVNLRTLQQYESGAKSIKRASAESVIALADVLHCSPKDLITEGEFKGSEYFDRGALT